MVSVLHLVRKSMLMSVLRRLRPSTETLEDSKLLSEAPLQLNKSPTRSVNATVLSKRLQSRSQLGRRSGEARERWTLNHLGDVPPRRRIWLCTEGVSTRRKSLFFTVFGAGCVIGRRGQDP